MKKIKSNFKDYFFISTPTLATYGLGYIFAILLKVFISPEDYGKLGYFLGISSFFQAIISFGRTSAVDLLEKENSDTGELFGSVTAYIFIGFIITITAINFFNFDIILLLSYFHAAAFILASLSKSILTYRKHYKLFAITVFISLFFSSVFSLFAIFNNQFSWRIIALIIGDSFLAVFFIKKLNVKIKFKTKDLLGYRTFKSRYLPLFLHTLLAFFYSFYDRIYIANNISFEESGDYWFIIQLTLPILVITEILIRKKISSLYNGDLYNEMISKKKYLIPIFIFSIIISFILAQVNIVFSVLIGQMWNSIYLITNPILVSKHKAKDIFLITAAIVLIQLSTYHLVGLDTIINVALLFAFLSILRSTLMLTKIFLIKQ